MTSVSCVKVCIQARRADVRAEARVSPRPVVASVGAPYSEKLIIPENEQVRVRCGAARLGHDTSKPLTRCR